MKLKRVGSNPQSGEFCWSSPDPMAYDRGAERTLVGPDFSHADVTRTRYMADETPALYWWDGNLDEPTIEPVIKDMIHRGHRWSIKNGVLEEVK